MENKIKNIIFITNVHLWSLGAGKGGKAFYHTIQGYISDGWNVTLISTGGGIPEDIMNKITAYERVFPLLEKLHNSKYKLVSVLGRFFKLYAHNRFYSKTAIQVIRENPKNKYIIYGYEVEAIHTAKYVAKRFNFPLVTRFQGSILSKVSNHWINRLRMFPHFNAIATNANVVIMTNDGTQGLKVLRKLKNNSENIFFWRNGVDRISPSIIESRDESRKEMGFSNNHLVFITVSRLIEWKRVDLAISGFAEVNKKYKNARLVIVGDGPCKEDLELQAEELNISESVIFTGAIEQKRVQYLLAASDVFLSFYDLSNLGNPIMEAMRVGLPVITIDVGDTKELIQDEKNGILIPADKLDLIPKKMELLFKDLDLRIFYSNESKHTAEKLFWSWNDRINAELEVVGKL